MAVLTRAGEDAGDVVGRRLHLFQRQVELAPDRRLPLAYALSCRAAPSFSRRGFASRSVNSRFGGIIGAENESCSSGSVLARRWQARKPDGISADGRPATDGGAGRGVAHLGQ